MTLTEALRGVELKAGRVYSFEVDDYLVELRVRNRAQPKENARPQSEPLDLEADTMLDAWVEFPIGPTHLVTNIVQIKPPCPDIPDIPQDEIES